MPDDRRLPLWAGRTAALFGPAFLALGRPFWLMVIACGILDAEGKRPG